MGGPRILCAHSARLKSCAWRALRIQISQPAMMILMNFLDDLDAMTIERLVQCGYRWSQRDTAFDRFAMFNTLTERKILQRPYEVQFSTHLLENPKYKTIQPVLDEITQRLRNGESLLPYLSRKAPEPRYKDGLLLFWGIHHLHSQHKNNWSERVRIENIWAIRAFVPAH